MKRWLSVLVACSALSILVGGQTADAAEARRGKPGGPAGPRRTAPRGPGEPGKPPPDFLKSIDNEAAAGSGAQPPSPDPASGNAAAFTRPVDPLFDDRPLPTDHSRIWVHAPAPRIADTESQTETACTQLLEQGGLPPEAESNVLTGRARARARMWRLSAAMGDVQAALALDPGSAQAHLARAEILALLSREEEAAAELDAAFRLDPQSIEVARASGLLHFQESRFAEAAEALTFYMDAAAESENGLSREDTLLGLLRSIARVRAKGGDADDPALRKPGANLAAAWPAPIGLFLAGRMERDEVLARAGEVQHIPTVQTACTGWFFLGQRALLMGDNERAARDFLASIRTGCTSAFEYRMAVAELIRLGVLAADSLPGRAEDS